MGRDGGDAGGPTLAPDIFDPATETWGFGTPIATQFPETQWGMRPGGRLVGVGGILPVDGISSASYMFDPLAAQVGSFQQITASDLRLSRRRGSFTLAGSGELVFLGGVDCYGGCFMFPRADAVLHDDGAPAAARPTLGALAASVVSGTKVKLSGAGFTSAPEGSTGTHASSPTNHPLAIWVADAGDATVSGTILDFTDTTATWLVPATAYHGHGTLFVSVGGVLSRGVSVAIDPAAKAVVCAFDAECSSGFCTDGVCCDRRCDGNCEGCSAARKTSGDDGVCGPVPPGRDIAGRCFRGPGEPCKEALECATRFCAQGVCCDSSCTGECQACNQASLAGTCSPIKEGACGAACDGDHTLQQTGSADVDCAPYKCEGPRCRTTCASVRDCVAPSVCTLDGLCAAAGVVIPSDEGVFGCSVTGTQTRSTGRSGRLFVATLGLSFLVFARGRRRRARPSAGAR